ncbi:adenylate kinase [Pilimelia columellifera]|uniref:Adenylate kinase n=1 Tax=Pilimelia columellifera subsp. columellifera TaxID=706583 RepID=A0ABN3NNL6_9ACTN
MRLLLIGPPGSGKGTQAMRVAAHYGIEHISSGALLRDHVERGTPIGGAVADLMRSGDLVPDGIVMDVLRRPVESAARHSGYVLDGFPRTVEQAEAAYLVARPLGASVRTAVHLDVSRPELVRRMLSRARHEHRTDDTQAVVEHRLDVFEASTRPLLDYYARRETLITVDGNQPVDHVTATIIAELDKAAQRPDGA